MWSSQSMFHLPLERIQLTAPDVGGGCGMKNFLSPEWVLVLWAARRLGRPVKWVAERIEEFVAGTQGRDNHTRARLALDEDSRFLGLDVSTVANLGRICRRTARAARPIRRRRQWAVSMRSRPYSWTCAAPLPTPCRSTPIAVQGGVAQGIGQALFEHTVYDPGSGQLLSGSLMDYTLPRADDLPPFDITLAELPTSANPLGVKGSGQAGCIAAPQTIINAIVDALAPLGIEHLDMPATPERVWRAIRRVRR